MDEAANERQVAFQKIVLCQRLWPFPENPGEIEIDGFAAELCHSKEDEMEQGACAVAKRVGVEFFAGLRVDCELFSKLTHQGRSRLLIAFYLAAWKFPLERMTAAGFPLADQDSPGALNHRGHDSDFIRHFL